ncbi:glycosyltransferase family 4 protein [Vibrio breoganii]|uniref:glycosyltransferase family 4 protein n=1 Tax=Vibrio breoganii TaxID=553239 RepID=UPI0012FFF74E|nr:glycosyltransferase [Vibrio breoganii]
MNGVLNNPYNEILFNNSSKIEGRIRNFLHVGTRSSKGTWDLLFAFHKIVFKYPKAILTIIGSGSELDSLKSYVRANGLSNNVLFSGAVDENEMSYLMSIHQYVVVPSKVDEAFGLVVIEGLASGCRVICSDDGGLPEALGGMGLVFHKGNLEELQTLLENALDNVKNYSQDETTTIKKHLANYKSDSVVKNYLSVFEKK